MLAQLKTPVLIKESIKLAFFRLVEYLEHQHLWVRLQAQKWPETKMYSETHQCILVLRNDGYPCEKLPRNWRYRTTLCTTPFIEQSKLALTRIERGVRGPVHNWAWGQIHLCLVWERRLTSPQLAASLNSARKTPVSTSTVKRRLRDAGFLGRVAKKKPYLRLANEKKRLRWAK